MLLLMFFAMLFNNVFCQDRQIKIIGDKLPIIEVMVNGHKVNMLIDTGSSINVIDINHINKVDVKKRFRIGRITHIGGDYGLWQLSDYNVDVCGVRAYQFLGCDMAKINNSIMSSKGDLEVDGILGTPAIKELKMIIDLSRGIVTINKNDVAQADN